MDDLPNDGALFNAFAEPEEQATERREAINKTQAAKPLLEDLIKLFEADIAQLKSIDSIPAATQLMPEEFHVAWQINQELLKYAREKKAYLESLLTTTKR